MPPKLSPETIHNIYDHLMDTESKAIFANRFLYSLTKDANYLAQTVSSSPFFSALYDLVENDPREKYIYGAGQNGKFFARFFGVRNFAGFIDSYVKGTAEELPIYAPEKLQQIQNDFVVYITPLFHSAAIASALAEDGCPESSVVNVSRFNSNHILWQYFDLPELKRTTCNREVFVDGGCFNGQSSADFVQFAAHADHIHLYAFEPDPANAATCQKNLDTLAQNDKRVQYTLSPKGLWSRNDTLQFRNNFGPASGIAQEGALQVPVTSIDETIDDAVTFIKMDIEGAEYEALTGAQNTIRKYSPRLAICVYHKPEDIWEIPALILQMNPDYKFWMRHYTYGYTESVLYAVPI